MPAKAVEGEVKVQVEPNKKLLKRKQQDRVQLNAGKCSLMTLHLEEVPMKRAVIPAIQADKDLRNQVKMLPKWSISV
jgi:hypothetical protein